MKTAVIGFPRIGALRELKFSSEKYFRNEITEEELLETGRTLRKTHWKIQKEAGIDYISCNDFSFYDNMLDTAVLFGIVPKRYKELQLSELDTYFAMARGYQGDSGDVKALAMKKWFNTNYHYIVPEVEDEMVIELKGNKLFAEYHEAKELGITTKPTVIGAYTLLKLCRYTGTKKMADYVDVESMNAYQMLLDQGKSPEQAFKIIQAKSRDNSRTPMQWDASENAGFSTGTPWLKVGKSYKDINVENEIDGPIFKFYKELIRLRKEMPIISEGSYQPALEDSQQVYAFERHLDGQKLLVLNNFYGSEAEVEIPAEYQSGRVLLSNYDDAELAEKVSLKPYQTLAILVK